MLREWYDTLLDPRPANAGVVETGAVRRCAAQDGGGGNYAILSIVELTALMDHFVLAFGEAA